jgi:signal transduction histidine kinase
MPETFPTTPRASRAVRLGAVAIGLLAVGLATRTTLTSAAWVGRVFPGFFLLDNRVVASVGLAHWPGATVPGLYQSQVVAVDDRPVTRAADVYTYVASLPPGTPLRYRLRWRDEERDVTIATRRFDLRDWGLVFGAYLLDSAVYMASGLVVWILRPRAALARTMLIFGASFALWLLTAMDLYGPAVLFRLHVVGEVLFPAAAFHLGLLFPQPHRRARVAPAFYLLSLALLVPYELFLYRPTAYTVIHNLCVLYLGIAAVFFTARLVGEHRRGRSALARQRIRVVTLGTLVGFAFPGLLFIVSVFLGGGLSFTPAALTGFLFGITLAYAVVKHDLFEIDAMVKRGAYYLLLTGGVGASYVGAVVLFNLILQAGAVTDSPAFAVAFTLAVLAVFNPLRTRLQAFVDRVFFRTHYDGARVLASVGAALASTLKRDDITTTVRAAVDDAIPNSGTRLLVGTVDLPPVLVPLLAAGRLLTAFDPVEGYVDVETHDAVRAGLGELGVEIAVPIERGGELVGVLAAGPKRSGLFYTAGDAEFLRALAHQTAIALQNAATYEELALLNASLEARVRERTAQLEAANQELADANVELRNAQVQLVQSEKMASLGRLVAGVAHEINNPVSFIATSVVPLRRRLDSVKSASPEAAGKLLAEAGEIVDIMARGAERTAAIVRDLRTFSRLGEAERKLADLTEGIDVSLRLLEARWRGRITIHRDYGELPLVECDPGQLNQVFMNVLANACDAIKDTGNIWVSTRADADTVTVTITDDGGGIAPEIAGRIFDPFFTTKDVGKGTGLGLAISHGVVTAHGGRIEVENEPGTGATFRIVLPLAAAAAPSLDRAAGGG